MKTFLKIVVSAIVGTFALLVFGFLLMNFLPQIVVLFLIALFSFIAYLLIFGI